MRENKFRVYCEFEINGEIEKSMESPASWFLLTQAGTLLSYGPLEPPQPLGKGYKKAIPLFYTGLKDKNGKEIYEGDIFNFHPSKEWKGTEPDNPCVVFWSNELSAFMFYVGKPEMSTLLPPSESIEIIGNIWENGDLLNDGKNSKTD